MQITPVTSHRDFKEFINLPASLHQEHRLWVLPLYQDEWRYFDFKRNRQARGSETLLLLARRRGQVVGRILGIVSHRANRVQEEKNGRFAFLECIPDAEVAGGLLNQVENWTRGFGMENLIGPKGFSNTDPAGYMIAGFDNEPTLSTYYNFPYLVELLEGAGYVKHVDYVAYKIPMAIPEFYWKIHHRISRSGEFSVLEFSSRRALKQYIYPVLRMMNDTYRQHDGYVALTEPEMQELAKRFIPLLNPHFIKIVIREEKLVGFILGMPNINHGLRKAGGRLFPLGIWHILRAARQSRQLDLFLGAIDDDYRGRGLDVLMGVAMYKSALEFGFEYIDSHLELETNTRVRGEMERAGGVIYKRYRIFTKSL
ncbi:MAG: hypothetical protein ABIA75_05950 [Candidatus Neomarinimicrobiota bacterium]